MYEFLLRKLVKLSMQPGHWRAVKLGDTVYKLNTTSASSLIWSKGDYSIFAEQTPKTGNFIKISLLLKLVKGDGQETYLD
jgi:hypothetical protein